jgi:hypothetical protein
VSHAVRILFASDGLSIWPELAVFLLSTVVGALIVRRGKSISVVIALCFAPAWLGVCRACLWMGNATSHGARQDCAMQPILSAVLLAPVLRGCLLSVLSVGLLFVLALLWRSEGGESSSRGRRE